MAKERVGPSTVRASEQHSSRVHERVSKWNVRFHQWANWPRKRLAPLLGPLAVSFGILWGNHKTQPLNLPTQNGSGLILPNQNGTQFARPKRRWQPGFLSVAS